METEKRALDIPKIYRACSIKNFPTPCVDFLLRVADTFGASCSFSEDNQRLTIGFVSYNQEKFAEWLQSVQERYPEIEITFV